MGVKKSVVNVVLFTTLLAGMIGYMSTNSWPFKILASASFMISAIYNYYRQPKSESTFARFMLLGIFFSLLGDILILLSFIAGAAFFALSHVFYIISYSAIMRMNKKDFAIADIIFIISLATVIITHLLYPKMSLLIVAIVYGFFLSTMLGKSISNMISCKDKLTRVIFCGSLAFYISDMALMVHIFMCSGETMFHNICRTFYFPAVFILANTLTIEKNR